MTEKSDTFADLTSFDAFLLEIAHAKSESVLLYILDAAVDDDAISYFDFCRLRGFAALTSCFLKESSYVDV